MHIHFVWIILAFANCCQNTEQNRIVSCFEFYANKLYDSVWMHFKCYTYELILVKSPGILRRNRKMVFIFKVISNARISRKHRAQTWQHCCFLPFFSEIDECQSNPCHNGGTCNDFLLQWTCACSSGYAGITCLEGRKGMPPVASFTKMV